MKTKELKVMNQPDLESKMVELKRELLKINSQVAVGTIPKNPSKIREIKKTIAKILTIKQQKEVSKRNE